MKISGNEIKPGMIIEHNDDIWEVLKTQHVKPGKGGAFNQVEMKSVNKSTKLNERFRSSDTIEKANIQELKFSYLYKDENKYYFMDSKSFEQVEINKEILGEKGLFLVENLGVTINFYDEKAISINLPNQIACKVDMTDVALKGQTVSSSYKPATLENGLKIQVPPFIESGDEIIIDTRTNEYIKKI